MLCVRNPVAMSANLNLKTTMRSWMGVRSKLLTSNLVSSGKAPEDWRTPRRWRVLPNLPTIAKLLECASPPALFRVFGVFRGLTRSFRVWLFLAALAIPARADKVDDYLAAQMQRRQIPGVALAVIRDGKTIKAQGYGVASLELREPVTPETVFEIGSLTKQFTAACVMLLVEQGKVGLDDSIGKYLEVPESWKGITVRHLLAHTSGIKNYTNLPGFEASRPLSPLEFIRKLSAYPLASAPGEAFAYCNSGYNLLGFIIEKVTGQSYWQFLRERIFDPLGMASSRSRDQKAVILNRAAGYEKENGKLVNRDSDLTDVFSGGAIVSTVLDLAKWNAAVDSAKLLPRSHWEQMWTPFKLNSGRLSLYGFGWRVDDYKGRRNIGHSGSTSGFSASLQRFPDDKLALIVLCNSGEQNIATTLVRGVADLYFPGGPIRVPPQ
jgi:D-alanyl-D-alanine carboxypeptidase